MNGNIFSSHLQDQILGERNGNVMTRLSCYRSFVCCLK